MKLFMRKFPRANPLTLKGRPMLKREETDDGTDESWRGKDPSAYTRIA